MKKNVLLIMAVFLCCVIATQAQNTVANLNETQLKEAKAAEKLFLEHAEEGLLTIEKAAQGIGIKGVAIMLFIPGDSTMSWVSKMKVEGSLTRDNLNFLGIANSKASEMAITLNNSGSKVRPLMHGELGYPGGVIKKIKAGYLLAAFSGGPSELDVVVATKGLEELFKYF
jgi:hypothetical protein